MSWQFLRLRSSVFSAWQLFTYFRVVSLNQVLWWNWFGDFSSPNIYQGIGFHLCCRWTEKDVLKKPFVIIKNLLDGQWIMSYMLGSKYHCVCCLPKSCCNFVQADLNWYMECREKVYKISLNKEHCSKFFSPFIRSASVYTQ